MRGRLLMPILIPVAVAGTIALLIFSVSKILLEAGVEQNKAQYATAAAITVALTILAVSSLVAVGPRLRPPLIYVVTALPLAAILAVGLYFAVRPAPPTEGGAGGEAAATVTTISQTATDNLFSQTSATVAANTEITLTLDNKGQATHNWHLLNVKDKGGKDITTKLMGGGQSDTIKFTIDKPGTYNFQCDVHPAEMKGILTVVEGAAAPAGGEAAAPAGGNTVVATDNKFDKATMTIKANEETTVILDNKGSAIHNWHVLNIKDKDGKDVTTKLLPGGQKDTIKFTFDKPGTYDFQCDVHPTEMKGKLTVQ